MMLVMYGYAINFDVRHVRLAVRDLDKSATSRDLVASFVNSTYFDQVADLDAAARPGPAHRASARPQAVLAIPEGYARDLAAGRTAPVQLLIDGADANTATTILGYASALVAEANARLPARRRGPGSSSWRPSTTSPASGTTPSSSRRSSSSPASSASS